MGLRETGLDVARTKGARLGRPKVVVDVARIANLRAQGRSWRNITEELGIGGKERHNAPSLACPKSYEFEAGCFAGVELSHSMAIIGIPPGLGKGVDSSCITPHQCRRVSFSRVEALHGAATT
jgi:hypothetical protein